MVVVGRVGERLFVDFFRCLDLNFSSTDERIRMTVTMLGIIWQDGCTADNAQKAGTNKTEPYFGTEKMPRSFMDVKSSKELEEALQIEKGKRVNTNTADDDRWRWTDVKQNTCVR